MQASTSTKIREGHLLAERYRIDGRLDSGATCVVYRAFDTRLQRGVAIKLLDPRFSVAGNTRALREARAASALNHPNICTVFEVDDTGGQAFIVMEYVPGKRLDRVIPPGVGLPFDQVLQIGRQVADGLSHAHDHGVMHRDLKPGNIMIGEEGVPKILDFGLALERERSAEANTETDVGDRPVAGTAGYIAPEVLSGHAGDARGDIWSLGVVLYELAVGEPPYRGRTSFEIASAVLRGQSPDVPRQVPPELREIIERCLQADPARRYRSAREVGAALAVARMAPRHRRLSRRLRIVAASLAALAAAVILAAVAFRVTPGIPATRAQAIAVIPVVEAGGGPNVEDLSDGIAQSVIDTLSELPDPRLNVIALSSVLRYRGNRLDMQRIDRELHPRTVLTLRVKERGAALTVDAELIQLPDNSHLWGDRFEAEHMSLALLPDRLAARICESLRIEMSRVQREHLRKRYSGNDEAYRLYLLGRRAWWQTLATAEGYEKSLDYYQQAIAKDPAFALAYVGLADTYDSMVFEGWLPPADGYGSAEKAVEKAVALDPALPDYHLTLAGMRWGRDWDRPAAAREYQRAIALSPGNTAAHRFYAMFLRGMGRWDDALQEDRRALDLDPLGTETNMTLGVTYHWARRDADAIEQYRRTLELDPNSAAVHDLLADALERVGRESDALAHRVLALKFAGGDEESASLAGAARTAGYQAAMQQFYRRSLDSLLEASSRAYVSPMALAMASVAAGDTDRAFEWLNRACDERHVWVTMLETDPAFDPVRRDPRFSKLVARVRLPD